MKLTRIVRLRDSYGVTWLWNGEYLWVKDLEPDVIATGDYGYHCFSLQEMFKILIEGGYILTEG